MRILAVIAALSACLALGACGGTNTDADISVTTSAAPTSSVSRTTTTPKPVTDYDRWAVAIRPYFSTGDITQTAFQYHQSLCTTLRNGGQQAIGTFPAQSPAEFLREGWGVGSENPSPGMAEKAEVAEAVIIPVLCPDQSGAIADAKAGNYVKELRTSFPDGKYLIGVDIAPGTYTIDSRVSDCYWERSDSQGNIIDNNLISVAPSVTVTIGATDSGFTSQRCGTWTSN